MSGPIMPNTITPVGLHPRLSIRHHYVARTDLRRSKPIVARRALISIETGLVFLRIPVRGYTCARWSPVGAQADFFHAIPHAEYRKLKHTVNKVSALQALPSTVPQGRHSINRML
jgi:hypothetical protein